MSRMSKVGLEKGLYPKSIAIIGASTDPSKIGYRILKAVKSGGFKGEVYPVNIKGGKILGFKAFKTVLDIPGEVDLALISIPSTLVPGVVAECGKKGVSLIVIFSAGFGEIRQGGKLEEKLVRTAEQFNVRIIGPNTNGILNLNIKLNGTFSPILDYREGNIAFICQSGGYSSALLRYGTREGVGFSKVINVGNSCDIGFADVLDFLADDEATEVIVMYMEGFKRTNEGRKFYEVAKRVTKIKPIIALKAGNTIAGKRAVRSHTGSLAGSDELYRAAFRQSGVIRSSRGVEMMDISKALSLQPKLPRGNRVAILTNLGGPGVVAADVCEKNGLKLPAFSRDTQEYLSKTLSPTASFLNPVDLAADWPYLNVYGKVLESIIEDGNVDSVLIVAYISPDSEYQVLLRDITNVYTTHNKPIIICCLSAEEKTKAICIKKLEKYLIPCYTMPEKAATALAGMVEYSAYIKK